MAIRTESSSFAFTETDLPIRFGRYLLIKRRSIDPIGEEFLAAWGVEEGVDQLRIVRGIYPSVAEESHFVALFSEEARSLSRLVSANVVRVMEVDVEGGIPFVAREHVEGITLKRLMHLSKKTGSTCTWENAVHIASELLRGLDYVHHREDILGIPMGMRHGDIRPINVIISFDGEVKLTSFGSALYFIADERTNARVQTIRGVYAPPEASAVDEATVAGDLWGVSAILSALMGYDDSALGKSRVVKPLKPALRKIDAFLVRALSKDPEARFQDAASMREILLGIMQKHVPGHPPDDLAAWTSELGRKDREEEVITIRKMFGKDPRMNLDDTTGEGRLGPGAVLDDRYHLLRQLGEGGMGLVFEAEHLGIGRNVAIKILHERVLDDSVSVERFRREAQITGSLGHPNIVGVSDFGVTVEGHHYLVMDLLDGESLGDRIQQGPVDPWELANIMAKVCDGLYAAHSAGVVHRDLKPENIFLTSHGPCVLDFGIAKRTGLGDEEQSLTRTGFLCGTAEYLAPEQVRGQDPDFLCDIYAAGVIIYEALTLNTPFRGRNLGETLHKVMSDKVVPPRKRSGNKTIPKAIEAICLKAIARKPQKRYKNAAEMAFALRELLEEESRLSGPQPLGHQQRKSSKHRTALWVVAVLGILTVFVLAGLGRAAWNRFGSTSDAVPDPDLSHKKTIIKDVGLDANYAAIVVAATKEPESKPQESPKVITEPEAKESTTPTKAATPKSPALKSHVPKSPAPDPRETARSQAKDLVAQGNLELKSMHIKKAVELFEEALFLDPRISEAWYGLGRTSFEQGQYKEAIKKVKYALRVNPGKYRWRIYLGKIYRSLGDNDKAVAEWERVLKTHPENEEAKNLVAKISGN
ncbi:MAG: protein kinase [Proteobacteria bacterium]|nr:protein kinase [Pseudomonadota bacterium]